jgi:hypothetical protein
MKFIYMIILAGMIGGSALAGVATLADWTARRVDQQQAQSLRQGSRPMGHGMFRGGGGHWGGGFGGGK